MEPTLARLPLVGDRSWVSRSNGRAAPDRGTDRAPPRGKERNGEREIELDS